jgi:hypothetical protein
MDLKGDCEGGGSSNYLFENFLSISFREQKTPNRQIFKKRKNSLLDFAVTPLH